MSSGKSSYDDLDGVRYHFPPSIPNGQRLAAGDVVALGRTKTSKEEDRDSVYAMGRIGRRFDGSDGAYVFYDRYLGLGEPIPFAVVGDPRSNVNSIVSVSSEVDDQSSVRGGGHFS